MINHIVFDMGNVLIRFSPQMFMENNGITCENDQKIIMRELYSSYEWCLWDWGRVTKDELYNTVYNRVPQHLKDKLNGLINWYLPKVEVIKGMEDLIKHIKDAGRDVYLLSNVPLTFYDYKDQIPGISMFSGMVLSAEEKLVKPQPEIYKRLYCKYNLLPNECFFIDDSAMNIAGAFATGMSGYVFDGDINKLAAAIDEAMQ